MMGDTKPCSFLLNPNWQGYPGAQQEDIYKQN